MVGLFSDPYRYVIDSSALFDLKNGYRIKVFKSLWVNFNKLCEDEIVISVREVYNEIKRGDDWLCEWADDHYKIFFAPTTIEEAKLIGRLQKENPSWIDPYSDKPDADPFIIASAFVNKLIIIQHEKPQKNLPRVAKELGISCIELQDFFEAEKWEW